MVRPLYVFMALTTTFVVVSWGLKGFPIDPNPRIGSELKPTIDSTFGKPPSSEKLQLKASRIAESAQDEALNKIRLDILQAANAYLQSPCDKAIKDTLVTTLTAYTKAWQNKLNCFRPLPIFMALCGEEKMNAAAAAFSTPLDKRIKNTLEEALDQKGIVEDDFPSSVRFDVLHFAG